MNLCMTIVGTLRDIETGIADIVLNNRVFLALGTKNCAFLTPVQLINLNFLTRKSLKQKVTLHFHLTQAFDKTSRLFYGIILVITVLAWNFVNLMKRKFMNSGDNIGIIKLVTIAISIQSSVSVPTKNFKSLHHRIFLTVLLIFALVKCNAFQGSVVSRLTSPPESTDTNTINDLIQKNLKFWTMISIPDLFKPNTDESNVSEQQKKIYKRQTLITEVMYSKIKKINRNETILGM